MAISPNTTFVSGAILTAAQMNALPFGVVAFAKVTANDTSITAEEIQITSTSFTAIANRYYRITYYEPQVATSTSLNSVCTANIRLTNLAGAVQGNALAQTPVAAGLNFTINCVAVVTLSAGATTIVGTLQSSAGNASAFRGATNPAFLLVEDIGPA